MFFRGGFGEIGVVLGVFGYLGKMLFLLNFGGFGRVLSVLFLFL